MSYQTYQHNRNYGCRISEFRLAGYRAVALENQKLRVTVLADKGADIYEFLYKPRDVDFMWRSWTGLRAATHLPPSTPRAAGPHMDYYEGGWQELFPNVGAASLHQGAEVGQHGEVLVLPWRYWIDRDDPEEIRVRFEVRTVRTPFHLVRTMSLRANEASLRIHERVTNEGGQAVDFTWGHHPAFGWPFIDEHCRVELGDCRIRTFADLTPDTSRLKAEQDAAWPLAEGRDGGAVDLSRVPPPDVAAHDMVFLEGLREGRYAVVNEKLRVGFRLEYPAEVFKWLWYWQVYRGGRDYPWWGATYNLALEPCATLPGLASAVERGEALRLEAGERREIELTATAVNSGEWGVKEQWGVGSGEWGVKKMR